MGIIFLVSKIFEFIYGMLLRSEIPVVVITKDLLNFSLWSIGILIVSYLYVWIVLKKNGKFNWSVNLIGYSSIVFWVIHLLRFFGTVKYFSYNINSVLVDFVALICTTVNLVQYVFYKYKIHIKEKQ